MVKTMVNIITGPINTGKTTWILNDFKKRENADGFACRKVRLNGEHIGYELIHLKTSEVCQFIRKIDYIPDGWNEAFRLGMHYSFNKEGQAFAEKIAEEAIYSGIKYFYLDEVAHLELKNQGFATILRKILAAKMNLVLVVRKALVEKICTAFNISDYQLIEPFCQG